MGPAARIGRQDAVRLRRNVPHGRRQDRRVVGYLGQYDDSAATRPYAECLRQEPLAALGVPRLQRMPAIPIAIKEDAAHSSPRTARLLSERRNDVPRAVDDEARRPRRVAARALSTPMAGHRIGRSRPASRYSTRRSRQRDTGPNRQIASSRRSLSASPPTPCSALSASAVKPLARIKR